MKRSQFYHIKYLIQKNGKLKCWPVFIVFVSLMTGCLVGPKYKAPQMQSYPKYTEASETTKNDTSELLEWTEVYKDQELTNLIKAALGHNLDLMAALGRIDEAAAMYGIDKSGLYPGIGYKVRATGYNFGDDAEKTSITLNSNNRQVVAGLATMQWEIDLFGKLRHQNRSSFAQLIAMQNNAQALRVSLIAQTATNYFILRDLDNRLQIANKTVELRKESLKTISARFQNGYVSELDQLQAQQQLAIAEALVPKLERQIIVAQNALRVLTGQAPGTINRGATQYQQQLPPEIPAGIPSDLLKRRPDIIASEQYLISQTEQIGVATAMRFPVFSLTGFFGLSSPELSSLVDPSALAMGIGGSLVGPIFEFNKNKRRVEVQKKKAEQLSFQYQGIVLNAFAEVDNSLASVRTYKVEHDANVRELAAASGAYELTQARYDNGFSNYLELLNQQNNLLASQTNESITQREQNIAIVNLFKALGGGWNAK